MSAPQDQEDRREAEAARKQEEAARKQAEALRRDREKAARAAAKEAARAERDRERALRDAEKAHRDRERAERNAQREVERLRAEQERAVREVEKEADQAQREAERAAPEAALAAQRAARQVERVRLRARAAEDEPAAEEPPLPPGLAVLWRPAPAGRRGPRPGLTLAGIARAAIDLADAEGLPALSMARVAERLGVTTMALYRYVSSKDDLLALMLDTALAESSPAEPVPGEGWRPALERWCAEQLALAAAHPWSVQPPVTSALPGPARVALLDRGLRALEGTPLTWDERVAVIGRLALHVLSEGQLVAADVLARRAAAAAAGSDAAGGGEPGPVLHPALLDFATLLRSVVDPAAFPALGAALDGGGFDDGAPDPAGGEGGDELLGLRLMLDGVEALMVRARAREAAG
jgi:AcrR family transcriptional regulator